MDRASIKLAVLAALFALAATPLASAAPPPRANAPVAVPAVTIGEPEAQPQPEPEPADAAPEIESPSSTVEPEAAAPVALPPQESRPLGADPGPAQGAGRTPTATPSTLAAGAVRTIGALCLVLGLIVGAWMIVKRAALRAGGIATQLGPGGGAPSGILTVLGRYPISRGQTLVLLKLDRRILLLSQTAAGFRTLSEVTDPEEVASILLKTRDEEGETIAQRFRSILKEAERDPDLADPASVGPGPTTPRGAMVGAPDPLGPVFGAAPAASNRSDAVGSLRRRLAAMRGGAS